MTTGTYTYERTYTSVDIRRVLGSFAADFAMMVASSGVSGWPRDRIDTLVADLAAHANEKYLAEIDVTLHAGEREVRAARYKVSESAQGWTNDRPGNSLWPRTPGGEIVLTAVTTKSWQDLPPSGKEAFRRGLKLRWGDSDHDITHAALVPRQDRRFASNGFGLERELFGA
jgi:hypothetical protein